MRPNKVRSVASSNSVKGAAKKAMIEGEEGGWLFRLSIGVCGAGAVVKSVAAQNLFLKK